MRPRGRPSTYTEEIGLKLCERIANGENVKAVCRDSDMPDWTTLMRWRLRFPEFATRYARAREASAEALEMEALEIAETATDKDTAAAVRVRVDAMKWAAAKRHPRMYGDRIDVNHEGKISLEGLVRETFKTIEPPTIEHEEPSDG